MGSVSVQFGLSGGIGDNVLGTTTIAGNTDGFYAVVPYTLTAGYNSVPVPSWAVGVQIVPPNTNTEALILKGATGDTGVPISANTPTGPIVFPGSPPATIGITAAGNVAAGPVFFRFF